MVLDRQIKINYIFKGIGIILGLSFVYLLRVLTDESVQADYFKLLVFSTIASSFISLPLGFISASSKSSNGEVKYLFYIQLRIALISTFFLGITFKYFEIEYALNMAILISMQSIVNQLPELFLFAKFKLIYGFSAFALNPALSIVFLLIHPSAIDVLTNTALFQLIITISLFLYLWRNNKTKKHHISDWKSTGSIYATEIVNNIKTNLDKLVLIQFANVKMQATFFIMEKIYRLAQTFFNVNASYYYFRWSDMSLPAQVIMDFNKVRINYNRAIWIFVIFILLIKPLMFSVLDIDYRFGNLVVYMLSLSLLIRLLTGYTFVLLKVLNPVKIFGLNVAHLIIGYFVVLGLEYFVSNKFIVPIFIIANSMVLSTTHWLGLRRVVGYNHFSRSSALSLLSALLIFSIYLCYY